jgi:hypothetical protein
VLPDAGSTARQTAGGQRHYALSGLLFCGICDRQMIGSHNNGRDHYRCTYASEYANANKIAHPRSVYVREDRILERLDPWLARAFSPTHLTATITAMVDAQSDPTQTQALAAAMQTVEACDARLKRYRAALEAGTDPSLVPRWISEVQAERAVAETRLRQLTNPPTMTNEQIAQLVAELGDMMNILRDADPADKVDLYRTLGLTLRYHPSRQAVSANIEQSGSCIRLCRRGDTLSSPTLQPAKSSAETSQRVGLGARGSVSRCRSTTSGRKARTSLIGPSTTRPS